MRITGGNVLALIAARHYAGLLALLADRRPDSSVHGAEQCSTPYPTNDVAAAEAGS